MHPQNSFLTLTLDWDALTFRGRQATVVKADLQKFFKRLRRHLEYRDDPRPVSYFACGEYGDQNLRPHYHALLFGWDFREDRKRFGGSEQAPLFTSPTLSKLWPHGFSTIGNVTYDSAAYVASYHLKKLTGPRAREYGQREPEFGLMSRNPAIGKRWLQQYGSDAYPRDHVIVSGQQVSVPRYYDRKKSESEPDMIERLKVRRKSAALEYEASGEATPERRKVLHDLADYRMQRKARETVGKPVTLA